MSSERLTDETGTAWYLRLVNDPGRDPVLLRQAKLSAIAEGDTTKDARAARGKAKKAKAEAGAKAAKGRETQTISADDIGHVDLNPEMEN